MRREEAAFVCRHILERERSVLLVVHSDDGDWQFLCGDDHEEVEGNFAVIHQHHLLEADPALRELIGLERGLEAERSSAEDAWSVRRSPPEE